MGVMLQIKVLGGLAVFGKHAARCTLRVAIRGLLKPRDLLIFSDFTRRQKDLRE
jgi:hypothetical protein